jgi:hypothetical protein
MEGMSLEVTEELIVRQPPLPLPFPIQGSFLTAFLAPPRGRGLEFSR